MSIKSFTEYLTETSLSRIWSYFSDTTVPAGIISASRSEYRQTTTNEARTMALARDVRAAGFGYVFADGHWIEKDVHGAEVHVEETSLIISGSPNDNGKMKGCLRTWRDAYQQESVLFKPEGTTHVFALNHDGTETDIGVFHADRVADMMTKLRGRGGRTFVFESAFNAMTWIERVVHAAKTRARS